MTPRPPVRRVVDNLSIAIYADDQACSAGAAEVAADAIRVTLAARGQARMIFAAAPSQDAMLARLFTEPSIDWSRVTAFQMDDYIGLPEDDPRLFGNWLAERFAAASGLRFERLRPGGDPDAEVRRYAELLAADTIDITCLGIGMNGHIAFNEPGSDLDDPEPVRIIDLDHRSREQQVTEGLFPSLDAVPEQAITLTVPALLQAGTAVGTVLGTHKAAAVAAAIEGPVGSDCPASALRRHPRATLHLDDAAAGQLQD